MIKTAAKRIAFVLFFITFLPIFSAHAATDDATAAKIRTVITDLLTQTKTSLAVQGAQLISDGELLIEPAGKYYAVTLPRLSVKDAQGSGADIGIIAMNVIPNKTAGLWAITLAVPSPITFLDKGGVPSAVLTIGRQSLTGIYHEKLKNLLSVNASYSDLAILDPRTKDGITIAQITAKDGLKEDANHEWSGSNTYTIEGIGFGKGKDSAGTIKTITLLTTIDRLNPDKLADYQDQMRSVGESMAGKSGQEISPAHAVGLYNLVLGNLGAMWNGFDSLFVVEGVDIVAPSDTPGGQPKRLKIDKAAFGMGMTGFRDNAVALSLSTQYEGFDVGVLPVEDRASVPTSLKIDMKIDKLPFTKLVDMGRMALQAIAQQPQNSQVVGIQLLAMLPKILTEAGTTLALNPSYAGNNDYRVDAAGSFKPDMNAMLGGVGQAKIQVFGFEKILEAMTAEMKKPNTPPEKATHIQDTLRTLTALQLAGQQGTDAQGRKVRTYDITLDQQGKSMLNGADMSVLFPQAAPKTEQAKAGAKP